MISSRCSLLAGWGMLSRLGMGWKICASIDEVCVDMAGAGSCTWCLRSFIDREESYTA